MNDPNALAGGWTKPEDLVGHVLADRYQIHQVLGDGGMGSVYLAEHVTLRKRVAIKVLHHELCRDKTQVDRFLQEARAASMIGHENIVDIVDFGPVPGGSVFFAMEYLEGEDLSELLRREHRVPWARARGLVLQIVRALGAAHDKGIIHRDLKPANCFLVRRSDGRDFVKLLDFGIAKVTDPESGSGSGLTRTGAVFGTAKYMAPEQAVGDPADARTDIYAAAVCLYEFLTGQVPYDGDNFMRVLSRHLTEPLTPPSTMAPDANISPTVEAVIVKALSKKPEDRYQSMPELEATLMAIGPDGNLAAPVYAGPPMAGQPMPNAGATLFLPEQGHQAPASHPPEGRGGTLMLDASQAPAELEFGTVRLGPQGWANQSHPPMGAPPPGQPPMAQPMAQPMAAPHVAPAALGRPPTGGNTGQGVAPMQGHQHATAGPPSGPATSPGGGDYTMFATEERSTGKFIAMLVGGAVIAIGGGGLFAWLLLADPSDDKPVTDPVEVAENADTKKDEPKKDTKTSDGGAGIPSFAIGDSNDSAEPGNSNDSAEPGNDADGNGADADDDDDVVEMDSGVPDPPEQEDDPPVSDSGDAAIPAPAPDITDNTPPKVPRKEYKGPRPKKILDRYAQKHLAKGFGRANKAVKICKGNQSFLKIKIKAEVTSAGKVVGVKALGAGAAGSIASCAVKAVRTRVKFPKQKGLSSHTWVY